MKKLLGFEKWQLETKGSVQLYANRPDHYVAVGPTDRYAAKSFVKEVAVEIETQTPR